MGGSFDGCYFLTITSLSSISANFNTRNTVLISEWINAELGVPSSRGYIRFVQPDWANYSCGGMTCLDMSEMDKERATSRMSSSTGASTLGNSTERPKRSFLGRKSRLDKLDETRITSKTPEPQHYLSATVSTASNMTADCHGEKSLRPKRSIFDFFACRRQV